MKVLKRVILAGIILVAVLGLGAYFAIKIAFPPQKIKALVSKHGSEALGREVSVSEVTIGVFPNIKLGVHDIRVANAPGFSQEPAIKLREAALSINFMSLLRFSPVINEVRLVHPEILYEVDAKGRNNLEGLGGKPDTVEAPKDTSRVLESPAAVALKSFVIEDGKVRYRDAQTRREIILDRINQNVSLDLDQRLEDITTQGKLVISEIRVNDPGAGIAKGNIQITVRHDVHANLPAERVQVRNLELGFQDIRAVVKGEATRFISGSPTVDFTLQAPEIRLASVLKEVPASLSPDIPKLTAKGVASLDARIKGVIDSASTPDVRAKLGVRDGAVAHKDLPAGVENLNIDLNLAGDSLRLSRFAFESGGNPVSVDALVTSLRQPVPMLQGLNVDALLDLGKIVPLLQKLAMLDKGMQAEGVIQAKVQGSGPLDPEQPQNLKAQGTIDLKQVTVKTPDLPNSVTANGQVRIDNDRIVQNLAVKTGQSDVAIDGTVTNYLALVMPEKAKGPKAKAKLSVKSDMLNLDELIPAAPKQEEPVKEGPPPTSWPSLPGLEADVDVKIGRTQLMGLAMTEFAADARLANSVLDSDLKGKLYTGAFSSSLKADLKDTSNADIGLKLKVDRVEANDFISRLNDRLPAGNRFFRSFSRLDSAIFGKFNLDMDVKTHGTPATVADNLTGEIDFGLFDGKVLETGLIRGLSDGLSKVSKSLVLKDLSFSKFTGNLEAQAGRMVVKHVNVDNSPAGALDVTGSIGFDNTLDLVVEDRLPPSLSSHVVGAGSALTSELAKTVKIPGLSNTNLVPTDKSGRAILYFLVGGTVSRPNFALDMKRMAAEGAGAAKGAMEAELRKKADELKAQAQAEKAKLEAEARARADEEKRKLQAKADEEKKKLEAQAEAEKKKAAEEAKKQGKKVLKGLGL
jgi:uncharacterized protein involved in outer membrane biogenesis